MTIGKRYIIHTKLADFEGKLTKDDGTTIKIIDGIMNYRGEPNDFDYAYVVIEKILSADEVIR